MAPCVNVVSDYCRLCAVESKNGIVIYSSEGVNLCLEEKIIQCLRIEVSKDDMLPKKVCNPCHVRLEDYHTFTKHANEVQHTLGLLIQMKDSLPAEASVIADKRNNDDISITVNNDPGVEIKDEPENIEIKDELLELPLDVTIEADGDSCIEPKYKSTDDDDADEEQSISGLQNEDEEVEDVEIDEEADKIAKKEWKGHWKFKCNQCEKIFPSKSQFDRHYRASYDKKPIYTCSFCNKTMEKYSAFSSHCYRHVTEGRYRCDYCQKGFSRRSMLHEHILAKHTTVKPFICEECGKGFGTKPALSVHLKLHRNEKLEFPCEECGKVLHTRGGLSVHEKVHKLGRRFMCDVCGKTFARKINLQMHVKQHTGERPFACEKCGKSFGQKAHLNSHYSVHSEKRSFQCKICMKMYKTETCLKIHAMVHAEARPYVCTYCSKGFLSTTKLKQHCNIHTGERPYACKFCDRTFTNYPNWLKHTRRRHKVDGRGGNVTYKKEDTQE